MVSFLLLTINHDSEGLINLNLKVGPHNTYPEHAHAAEEGYHFLAGDISKHLKGRFGPPVNDGFGSICTRSVGAPRE